MSVILSAAWALLSADDFAIPRYAFHLGVELAHVVGLS